MEKSNGNKTNELKIKTTDNNGYNGNSSHALTTACSRDRSAQLQKTKKQL